jgi:hypothetical protein
MLRRSQGTATLAIRIDHEGHDGFVATTVFEWRRSEGSEELASNNHGQDVIDRPLAMILF